MIFEPRSHPLERSESGQKALLRAPGGAGIFDEGENTGARSRGVARVITASILMLAARAEGL